MIRVALERFRLGMLTSSASSCVENSRALSEESAMTDNDTSDFPRPISSARMPPFASIN